MLSQEYIQQLFFWSDLDMDPRTSGHFVINQLSHFHSLEFIPLFLDLPIVDQDQQYLGIVNNNNNRYLGSNIQPVIILLILFDA